MQTFFIFGLPRSRLAWLANALTYEPAACLHEGLWGCVSVQDLRVKLEASGSAYAGNSDVGNTMWLDRLLEAWPKAPLVVVLRDIDEVRKSMRRCAPQVPPQLIDVVLEHLEQVLRMQQTLTVRFDELDDISVGEAIWDHCIPGSPFNANRWTRLSELNVQVNPEIEHARYAAMTRDCR